MKIEILIADNVFLVKLEARERSEILDRVVAYKTKKEVLAEVEKWLNLRKDFD